MAEVPFRPVRQLSEYKGKGASASREETERVRTFIDSRSSLARALRTVVCQIGLSEIACLDIC